MTREDGNAKSQPVGLRQFLVLMLAGLVGTALGGLIGYVATGEAAVWVAAVVAFVLLETFVIFVRMKGPIDARRLFLWTLLASVGVGLASGVFFFIRAALA